MKQQLHSFQNYISKKLTFLVILFFIFSNDSFSQGTTCATSETLTINGACDAATITDNTQNAPNITGCSPTNFRREGWYTFTVSGGPKNVTITASASNMGLYLQLISSTASCTGLTEVTCQNADGANNSAQTEVISSVLNNGIYYIKVVNEGNNNDMNLTSICVTSPTAATNTTCATATTLPCATTNLAGSTVGTSSIVHNTGCSMSNYGVWYTFVGDGQQTTITSVAGGGFDHEMSISSGSCGALTSLACEDSGLSAGTESYTFTTVTATTYYVYIAHYSTGSVTGTFTISRTCTAAPIPPANNLCANATTLPCGTTNLAGTTVATANIAHNSGCTNISNYGVWYTFIGDGNPTTITTNPSFDIKLSISTGNCTTMTNIACTDTFPEQASFTTLIGTTYYVYVAGYGTTGTTKGAFTISRSCVTCAPPTATATTNITFTTATVNWDAPISYIPSNGYQYAVTTSATPPASGTATTANTINLTGLTANTLYYLHVRSDCGAINGFSTWSTISFTTGYCTSISTSATYYIDNFSTTGGVTNINNNTAYSAGGYGDFSAQSVSQLNFGTVNFSALYAGSTFGFSIWVDWNNDLDFDDTGELMYNNGDYFSSNTGTFTVPGSASIGNHRMRIRANYFDTNPSACGSITGGETEDYTFTVLPPLPCGENPTNITVFIVSQTAATINWVAPTPAPPNGYQYFVSTSSATPAAAAVPTGTTTAAVTSANLIGLVSGSTYYVWVRSNCGAPDGLGIWIGPISIKMPTCAIGPGTGTTTLACPDITSGGLGLTGADPVPVACGAGSTCVDLEANYLQIGEPTSYTVSQITYAPPYQFNCLRNPVSVNIDDKWSSIINLPFDFCFYGNNYNKCIMGSNGVLSFDTTNNTPGGTSAWSFSNNLPSTNLFTNTIFGVYQDIDPSKGGEIGWELITLNTGCRALVASWSDVPMFSSTCNSQLYTGMMVLYENTNIIEVYIEEKNVCGTWNDGNAIVGLQNIAGNQAVVAPGRNGLDTDWTVTNEAFRFTPSGTSISTITWFEGSGVLGPVVGNTDVVNVCPASTTTYTAQIEYALCNGTTLIETDEVIVTVSGNKVWDGSVSTDWNVPANWTPVGVPAIGDCVVVPNVTNQPVVIGTNYSGLARNLVVQPNATLDITATNAVTVTNEINVNTSGILNVQDDGSILQINNVANTGNIRYNRMANIRKYDYVYWSSPVANFSSSAISPGTNLSLQYKWIPTISTNTNGFGNWTLANENMVNGKGYIVRGPDAFTNTAASNFTATFVGVPNNGNISIPISRGVYNTDTNYSTGVSPTMATRNDDNWNLVGNPYPSSINALDFLTLNSNIQGFIKVWTHGSLPSTAVADPFYQDFSANYTPNDYITHNGVGTVSGPAGFNGFIGAGQGFFVSMNHSSAATTENLLFTNSLRKNTSNIYYNNSQFYRNKITKELENKSEKNRIWLDLVSPAGNSTRTLVGYVENATNNQDRLYDADANVKSTFSIFSVVNNNLFSIQGRELPFFTFDKVALGITTPQNGEYKIAIHTVDGLFENTNKEIYLEDKVLNTIHNLRVAPYVFTANNGIVIDRFVLRYSKKEVTEVDNEVKIIQNANLNLTSLTLKIKEIEIFDTLGKLIFTKNKIDSYEYEISEIQKTNNLLVIKVKLEDNSTATLKTIY